MIGTIRETLADLVDGLFRTPNPDGFQPIETMQPVPHDPKVVFLPPGGRMNDR